MEKYQFFSQNLIVLKLIGKLRQWFDYLPCAIISKQILIAFLCPSAFSHVVIPGPLIFTLLPVPKWASWATLLRLRTTQCCTLITMKRRINGQGIISPRDANRIYSRSTYSTSILPVLSTTRRRLRPRRTKQSTINDIDDDQQQQQKHV